MLTMPIADQEWFRTYISRVRWKTSKQSAPHIYTVKEWETDWTDFNHAVCLIRSYGRPENFYRQTYIYLYFDDLKYWTMGSPIEETEVINKAPQGQFYGQQKDYTSSFLYEESIYDRLAPRYDHRYSNEECLKENEEVFSQIKPHIQSSWTVLDIGCGTGLALEYLQILPDRYLGIDPSQGMRNEFVRKYPKHSFLQATLEDADLLIHFDACISLFGSISYIDPNFYPKIRASADDYFLMVYKEGYCPDYESLELVKANYERLTAIFGEPKPFNNFLIYSNLGE